MTSPFPLLNPRRGDPGASHGGGPGAAHGDDGAEAHAVDGGGEGIGAAADWDQGGLFRADVFGRGEVAEDPDAVLRVVVVGAGLQDVEDAWVGLGADLVFVLERGELGGD